jgi:hypothetical protein
MTMNNKKRRPKAPGACFGSISRIVASIVIAGASTALTKAVDSDALLNKLIEKGVLTTKEAEDLKKESATSSKKDWVKGAGMPEWVTGVKLYGDFRGRFEENAADSSLYNDRNRYRYRLRLGMTTTFLQNFEVGLRLATGNPLFRPNGTTIVGGSVISGNQDINSLDSRKFVWIDAAYGKWTAVKNDSWNVSGTIGKFDNPFQVSNMVYDYDFVPEGAAIQAAYNINEQHTLKANTGIFILDEFNQGAPSGNTLPTGVGVAPSHDPFLMGAQALWEAKWTPDFDTSLGVAGFAIDTARSLSSNVQPFYNSGNTRDANGFLKYNMDPIMGSAAATYKFNGFPLYPGKFPVKLAGEFMHNPSAPADNDGWRAGMTFGKAGKKHAWEISYRYQRLEADAWYDAMPDDDNGAFYEKTTPLGPKGWFGGTNVKSHQVLATYSITDFLNFTFTYFDAELVKEIPGANSHSQHFMADLNWKF